MRLGYHSNGLTQHAFFDALELLAETGYQSVAINIDHGWLAPIDHDVKNAVQKARAFLQQREMSCVVEANANFLLDAKRKNYPSLIEHDPGLVESRMRYLKYCVDIAAELGADCMSMQSGYRPEDVTFDDAMSRLVDGVEELLLHAAERDVVVSIEPQAGMLVDTLGRFDRLLHLFDSPRLMLTLDVSNAFSSNELPLAAQLDRWQKKIANIHIADVVAGGQRHLPFGDGEVGFPLILDAIADRQYKGGIHIDLPDYSHDAASQLARSFNFLQPLIQQAKAKHRE